jgi:hypothetical protein
MRFGGLPLDTTVYDFRNGRIADIPKSPALITAQNDTNQHLSRPEDPPKSETFSHHFDHANIRWLQFPRSAFCLPAAGRLSSPTGDRNFSWHTNCALKQRHSGSIDLER